MGETLILLFLLVFSASFSAFETALFSLSPLQQHLLQKAGGISALIAKTVQGPRSLLTTVLFGNELVNVGIAIFAGNLAYDLFRGYEVKTVYLFSTAITTLGLLIFGEIIPKNIAVRYPAIVSQALILPYQFFAWLIFPFRVVFTKMTERFVQMLGVDPHIGHRMIVDEELRILLERGKEEGTLAELERTLIQNTLDFSKLTVTQIMTPRERIVAIPLSMTMKEILKTLESNHTSRLPVYEDHLDQIIGVLHAKELLPYRLKTDETGPSIKEILKPCAIITPDQNLDYVFEEFQRLHIHMGLIKDSHGKVVGLVTMDDLLRRFFPS